jgi:hypothetical protein
MDKDQVTKENPCTHREQRKKHWKGSPNKEGGRLPYPKIFFLRIKSRSQRIWSNTRTSNHVKLNTRQPRTRCETERGSHGPREDFWSATWNGTRQLWIGRGQETDREASRSGRRQAAGLTGPILDEVDGLTERGRWARWAEPDEAGRADSQGWMGGSDEGDRFAAQGRRRRLSEDTDQKSIRQNGARWKRRERPGQRRRRRWPETTAAERKENFRSKHELRPAVDALNLGSDTMLRICNLHYQGAKGHIYSTCTGCKYAGNPLTDRENTIYNIHLTWCYDGVRHPITCPDLNGANAHYMTRNISPTHTKSIVYTNLYKLNPLQQIWNEATVSSIHSSSTRNTCGKNS